MCAKRRGGLGDGHFCLGVGVVSQMSEVQLDPCFGQPAPLRVVFQPSDRPRILKSSFELYAHAFCDKKREREKQRERGFHMLGHSPNGHAGPVWCSLKLGVWTLLQLPHVRVRAA